MFFIGIFGIDKRNDKVRALQNTECRECSGHSLTLYKEYYRFHFFFIPLITWGKQYRVVCESCSSVFAVREEKDSYSYWDLNEILFRGRKGGGNFNQGNMSSSFSGASGSREKSTDVCPYCGADIKDSWTYCPVCGKIISE